MYHRGWFSQDKSFLLSKWIHGVKSLDGAIMDIGCCDGKSTIHIANACYPEKVLCNDVWDNSGKINLFRVFTYHMHTATKGNYRVINQDCQQFIKLFDSHIKFLHIGAYEDDAELRNTIKGAFPQMITGGIMCGDHFLKSGLHGNIERVVRELLPDAQFIGNLWYAIL